MNLTDTDARTELNALFASISRNDAHCKPGLHPIVSGARLLTDESKWDHVEVTVTFTRTAANWHGRTDHLPSESFTWRMGLGLIDWAVPFKRAFGYGISWYIRERYRGPHRLSTSDMKAIIQGSPAVLNLFVKACSPAEVLARACADGQLASQPFAMWADEIGMDSDSIKARDMYDACQNEGIKARRLVDGETSDRLAELANAL